MNRWIWLGCALVAFLAWGLEQVVVTPLETGEVYPPYSSLRVDPLGAKALYDSLAGVMEVERLYKQRTALADPADTMLELGVDPVAWSGLDAETIDEYRKLVEHGGRLVIGFLPVRTPSHLPTSRPVEAMWGIRLRYRQEQSDADQSSVPRETALYFDAGPGWNTHRGFVERQFGAGVVVLVADTFPLSNEGLRETQDAAWIAELIGPSRRAIFDENHFGVMESGSVTTLMRKYRLEGAVAVLAVVAGLFFWRGASSLLPPRKSAARSAVAGRDSLEGMTALLHRGVAEKDLVAVCFAEWSKMERSASRVGRVEDQIRTKDPVAAYRDACRAASSKKHSSKKQ
jgi:hypothetical protein